MGLDFIKQCAPTFKLSWDRNRVHLAELDLFTQFPALKGQTFRALAREGNQFRLGQEFLLMLDGDVVAVCDRNVTFGEINNAPQELLLAIKTGGGVAVGTVQSVLVEGRAADMTVA